MDISNDAADSTEGAANGHFALCRRAFTVKQERGVSETVIPTPEIISVRASPVRRGTDSERF